MPDSIQVRFYNKRNLSKWENDLGGAHGVAVLIAINPEGDDTRVILSDEINKDVALSLLRFAVMALEQNAKSGVIKNS